MIETSQNKEVRGQQNENQANYPQDKNKRKNNKVNLALKQRYLNISFANFLLVQHRALYILLLPFPIGKAFLAWGLIFCMFFVLASSRGPSGNYFPFGTSKFWETYFIIQ